MANAAAIKGALLQTKSLKTPSVASATSTGRETPKVAPFQLEEDSKWIKRVIQQEHIKPLEVSKDFVLEYERKEKENSERLSNQVDRHISTLKQLRMKLESRHDLKSRTEEYRQWQRDFLPKKHAVMLGKTVDELETGNNNSFITSSSPTTRQGQGGGKSTRQELDEINDELMNRTLNRSSTGGGGHQSSQELSNVLDSLSKLADLEKRISSLEKENKYDQLVTLESPTAGQRTKHEFEFRKKRTQIEEINAGDNAVISSNTNKGGPMGMVYEIRPKKGGKGGNTCDSLFSDFIFL
jgi:polyhydroxyalkanoate synthesis regulator phasin